MISRYHLLKNPDLDPKFTRTDHLISQKKYEREDEHYISLKNKIEDTNLNDFEKVDLYFNFSKSRRILEILLKQVII